MFAIADTAPFGSGAMPPPALPSRLDHDLSHQPPGPMLALMLESLDVDALSPHDQVVVLRHRQRMALYYEAQVYAGIAAVAGAYEALEPDLELAFEAAAGEVAAALRLTRRGADLEMAYAVDLQHRLPVVWARLAAGDIDLGRAKTIVHGVEDLEPEVARVVVDAVIDDAHRLTSGQLSARLRKLCIDADPEDATRRYEQAVAERRVVTEPTTEGTANLLGLDLPPDQAPPPGTSTKSPSGSGRRVTPARSINAAPTSTSVCCRARTPLQVSGRPSRWSTSGSTSPRSPASTRSAELAGFGPVLADIGRQVAERQEGAEWRFTVTHAGTGRPMHVGTTRPRRPTAAQRRGVEAGYVTCIFPGCRMPARQRDVDHQVPWSEGGRTCECSLFPACRHHHMLKHERGWRYEVLPDGDILWISPLGHRYTMSGRAP